MTAPNDWGESLPEGWTAIPLRAVAEYLVSNVDKVPADDEVPVRLCNYSDVYHNEFITLAMDLMRTTATEAEVARFGLRVGDVLITKDSESWDDIGVPALVIETAPDLVCGYHLALLRPHASRLDGRFLLRCLQARPIRVQLELAANGVTRFGIPKSDIGAMLLPVPPLDEQRAIADYLDEETARIDALIAAKERLLALLAEKRRAMVVQTVTRGVDPQVPLINSGIPWLGEIPAHWRGRRMRWLTRSIEQGWSPEAESRPPVDGEWGVLKLGAVKRGAFDAMEAKALPAGVEALPGLEVRDHDFLITRSNTPALVGDVCFVSNPRPQLMLCDLIYRLRLKDDVVDGDYLSLFLTTSVGRAQVRADARGTSGSMVKISQEHIKDWCIPVPPLDEQRAIVRDVNDAAATIDDLHASTTRSIELLKERRAALITAAVTGALPVPALA